MLLINIVGCTNGDARLVHVNNPLEGRVEVCYDGVWGTVCGSGWDVSDASVVCRQLGYSGSGMIIIIIHTDLSHPYPSDTYLGAIPRTDATLFGQGTGPVFLYYVACRGLESRLLDCPNGGIELNTCSHNRDAGVTCLQGVCM